MSWIGCNRPSCSTPGHDVHLWVSQQIMPFSSLGLTSYVQLQEWNVASQATGKGCDWSNLSQATVCTGLCIFLTLVCQLAKAATVH